MPSRILIVPDKFKGTLSAEQAAQAIAAGWRESRPRDVLELLPMSDGGDGFGHIVSQLIGAQPRTLRTCDAAHRPCAALWWWHSHTKTAVLDSAAIIGLAMLPPNRFHPFGLDTFGLGALLRRIETFGALRCLVGLGGSATNDAGFGLARSLGWTFLNSESKPINSWPQLSHLAAICPPAKPLRIPELIVAVDVQNVLLGARGATRVYGPQKGLKSKDFPLAERAFARLVKVVRERTPTTDFSKTPGAGAAGGLGFGFLAFVGGRLESGFDLFAKHSGLERKIRRADLVITGEGAIDRSSFMGKGAGRVARLCADSGVPCLGFAGSLGGGVARRRKPFAAFRALTNFATEASAKRDPETWLRRLASSAAKEWTAHCLTRPPARPQSI